jgi:hypothetical protein
VATSVACAFRALPIPYAGGACPTTVLDGELVIFVTSQPRWAVYLQLLRQATTLPQCCLICCCPGRCACDRANLQVTYKQRSPNKAG